MLDFKSFLSLMNLNPVDLDRESHTSTQQSFTGSGSRMKEIEA